MYTILYTGISYYPVDIIIPTTTLYFNSYELSMGLICSYIGPVFCHVIDFPKSSLSVLCALIGCLCVMVLPDRWRCWRGSTGARLCPGGQRERSRRRSGSTAWTRTSRGFAAPPPRAGWPAASSFPTWGCRYTHTNTYTLFVPHINTQQKVMCMFVWVQYSFDERQPQGQGSAGQQGSDDTGDMDDSFSKQVNPHLSPWNQWHQWNSTRWRLAWRTRVCVDVTALAFRQYCQ